MREYYVDGVGKSKFDQDSSHIKAALERNESIDEFAIVVEGGLDREGFIIGTGDAK